MMRLRKSMGSLAGFTLLEILVSAVIMSLVMVGLANVFFVSKGYMLHSRNRTVSGGIGRYFVEPLWMQVRQDRWNNNSTCLSQNATSDCSMSALNISGITYTPSYIISAHPSNARIRKVVVNITWSEPQ